MRRTPDELRADRGRGRLSKKTEQEFREVHDGAHSRRMMGPFAEIEVNDERVALAGEDEHRTQFDPGTHPKPPHPKEEGVTDVNGDLFQGIDPVPDCNSSLCEADLLADDLEVGIV